MSKVNIADKIAEIIAAMTGNANPKSISEPEMIREGNPIKSSIANSASKPRRYVATTFQNDFLTSEALFMTEEIREEPLASSTGYKEINTYVIITQKNRIKPRGIASHMSPASAIPNIKRIPTATKSKKVMPTRSILKASHNESEKRLSDELFVAITKIEAEYTRLKKVIAT